MFSVGIFKYKLHSEGANLTSEQYGELINMPKETRFHFIKANGLTLTPSDQFFLDSEMPAIGFKLFTESARKLKSVYESIQHSMGNIFLLRN